MKIWILLLLSLASIAGIAPVLTSAQTNCLTTADTSPCDGTVSLAELTTHINKWYACSSCHPDIFNALQAYFHIPFCGDWSCNATVGEDCSSCSNDCGNCTAPQPNASFPQDYIAYWKFENNVNDETGVNNGTINGNPVYVPGQVGQAIDFDGIDDYVTMTKAGSPLNITRDEVTMSFWANGNFGIPTKYLVGIGESDASESWKTQYQFYYRNGPVMEFVIDTPTSHNILQSSTPFNSGEWIHVAGVYNGSNMYVYLNGNLENTQSLTGNIYSNKVDFSVGANALTGGMTLDGSIDEVMVYNRSLSTAEIQQIYFAQSGISCFNDTGCSSSGSFCNGNIPYTCTLNASDGCLDRVDGTACLIGEICSNGICISDPCLGITQCSDYLDLGNCTSDGCSKGGGTGCVWTGSVCEDGCAGFTQCSNYIDITNCSNNPCSVGVTGCTWNSSSGACEDVVIAGNVIFVDNQLTSDCVGTYSIANRDCSGSDGDAYNAIADLSAVYGRVVAGDIIFMRNGSYDGSWIGYPNAFGGSQGSPINFENYNNEDVTIKGFLVGGNHVGLYIHANAGDYFTFKGLKFTGANLFALYAVMTNNLRITNCVFYSNFGHSILFGGVSNSSVENCEFFNNHKGIFINYYNGSFSGGVVINSTNNTINNNLVYNNTLGDPENCDGITLMSGAFNNTVSNNVVFNSYDDGIDSSSQSPPGLPGSRYSLIENNIVFDSGDGPGDGDGNGIKVSTNHGGGHVIRGNVVFNAERSGFDQDKGLGYPQNFFYNNLVYNNGGHGFTMDVSSLPPDEDAVLYNNLAFNNLNGDFYESDIAGPGVYDSDYNFWGDGNFPAGMDAHSLSGDPGLMNQNAVIDTNFNPSWTLQQKLDHIRNQVDNAFSLNSTSQLIDKGMVIAGYHCTESDDLGSGASQTNCRHWKGTAPDIGAYEY